MANFDLPDQKILVWLETQTKKIWSDQNILINYFLKIIIFKVEINSLNLIILFILIQFILNILLK